MVLEDVTPYRLEHGSQSPPPHDKLRHHYTLKQDTQCACSVTLRRVRVTVVAVEKQ
jgi:hypothetical protein